MFAVLEVLRAREEMYCHVNVRELRQGQAECATSLIFMHAVCILLHTM